MQQSRTDETLLGVAFPDATTGGSWATGAPSSPLPREATEMGLQLRVRQSIRRVAMRRALLLCLVPALAFLTIAPACADVASGGGWVWQNPLPQGNYLDFGQFPRCRSRLGGGR